jgi:hypothetical protein
MIVTVGAEVDTVAASTKKLEMSTLERWLSESGPQQAAQSLYRHGQD